MAKSQATPTKSKVVFLRFLAFFRYIVSYNKYFPLLILLVGCDSPPPAVYPDKPDANAAANALTAHDTNKDGQLDAAELEKTPGLKAGLALTDSNGDKKLSADEISARLQKWAGDTQGRLSISLVVTRQGKPLTDASIKLIPETFLGTGLKAASGTTDSTGNAICSITENGESVPGVSPGYYKVEITTADNSLPAIFNTATTLGMEVAPDSLQNQAGPVRFNLP
jgi:hypothetical protein